MSPFIQPRRLLQSGAGTLGRLGMRAAQLAEATRILREHLTPPLADHASVAAIRGPTLVVVVDSPVWAARLRYRSAEILDHFAAARGTPRLSRLRILVRPSLDDPKSASTPPRRPVRPSSRLIRSVSETLEAGPLRERMARLAAPVPSPPEEEGSPRATDGSPMDAD